MSLTSTAVLAFNRKDGSSLECMPGYKADSPNNLEVMYAASNFISVPGATLLKRVTTSEPTLGTKARLEGRYIIVMLDPDAPSPSLPFLGPVLHWIQTDLGCHSIPHGGSFFPLSAGDTPAIVPYLAPQPPPVATPHRYMFLLYAQPEDFSATRLLESGIVSTSTIGRLRFKVLKFEKVANLGPVIAANYFLCSGKDSCHAE